MTWTLCSITDARTVPGEIRGVLRPGGRLLVVERGRAPDPPVRCWQEPLNSAWRRLAEGCNLGRPIDTLISEARVEFTRPKRGYGNGPRAFDDLYRGIAEPTAR